MTMMQCPKALVFEWEVTSSTGRGKYTITKDSCGKLSCSCLGFRYNQKCKHTTSLSVINNSVCIYKGTYNLSVKKCPYCDSELIFDYFELEIGNEVI